MKDRDIKALKKWGNPTNRHMTPFQDYLVSHLPEWNGMNVTQIAEILEFKNLMTLKATLRKIKKNFLADIDISDDWTITYRPPTTETAIEYRRLARPYSGGPME